MQAGRGAFLREFCSLRARPSRVAVLHSSVSKLYKASLLDGTCFEPRL